MHRTLQMLRAGVSHRDVELTWRKHQTPYATGRAAACAVLAAAARTGSGRVGHCRGRTAGSALQPGAQLRTAPRQSIHSSKVQHVQDAVVVAVGLAREDVVEGVVANRRTSLAPACAFRPAPAKWSRFTGPPVGNHRPCTPRCTTGGTCDDHPRTSRARHRRCAALHRAGQVNAVDPGGRRIAATASTAS